MADYIGAINEGYTNDDLRANIGIDFDFASAVKEGYTNEEIDAFISQQTKGPVNSTPKVETKIPTLEKLRQQTPDITTMPKAESVFDKFKKQVIDIIPSQKSLDVKRDIVGKEEERTFQAELEAQLKEGTPVPGVQPLGLENSFIDPTLNMLGNKVAEGAFKLFGKAYDLAQMRRNVRNILASKTPEKIEEMKEAMDFASEQGINLTNVFVAGSNESNMMQFLTKSNYYAVKDAVQSQEVVQTRYLDMLDNILQKFKASKIDTKDITSWKSIKKAESIVAGEVDKLRQAYKAMEGEAFDEAGKLLGTIKDQYKMSDFTTSLSKELADEGIDTRVINVVNKELLRFVKPYADETGQLKLLEKKRITALTKSRQLKLQQKKALESNNITEAEKLEQQIVTNSSTMSDISSQIKALKDVRYMTPKEMADTIKLLNSKIYKPGGAISVNDAAEIRGLQIAKSRLTSYLHDILPEGQIKESMKKAKDLTIARTALFGAKDSGGEKIMLAHMLETGDYGKVTNYLTGTNAKENLTYLRDIFGKDSEAYQTGLRLYTVDKLGLTPEKLGDIVKNDRVAGVSGLVDITASANYLHKLVSDSQNIELLKQAIGASATKNLKSLSVIMNNFKALEAANSKLPNINQGFIETTLKSLDRIKDAITYTAAKTASKIIANQPKFRTLTGAATSETIYLANTEDKDLSLEGVLLSAVGGGVAGYYGGKFARSILEDDITKIARYLKSGKVINFSKGMPTGLVESLERYGKIAKQMEDEALKAPGQFATVGEALKDVGYREAAKENIYKAGQMLGK